MAGLADDWEENRQTCVDVLCGYLRMPYEPDPGEEAPGPERLAFRASREVRHTVIRVITAHLKEGAAVSWQGLNFDFTGVVFDGGDFRDAEFSGGTVDFSGAKFSGGAVDFGGAEFSGGTVDFGDARFSGGTVNFGGAEFSGGTVNFDRAAVLRRHGQLRQRRVLRRHGRLHGAEFSGGAVSFTVPGSPAARSTSPSPTSPAAWSASLVLQFSGGTVDFASPSSPAAWSTSTRQLLRRHGRLRRRRVLRRHGRLHGAEFSGGKVDFGGAEFSGGTVDFTVSRVLRRRRSTSAALATGRSRPIFPWTGTPPPGVTLPSEEDQSQA